MWRYPMDSCFLIGLVQGVAGGGKVTELFALGVDRKALEGEGVPKGFRNKHTQKKVVL